MLIIQFILTILPCIYSDIRVHTETSGQPTPWIIITTQKEMDEMIGEKQEPHYISIEYSGKSSNSQYHSQMDGKTLARVRELLPNGI